MPNSSLLVPLLRIPFQRVPVSTFAFVVVLGFMLLPAGCTASGRDEGQGFSEKSPTLETPKRSELSPRAEQIFAQLKLDRALEINDREGVLDACAKLLEATKNNGSFACSPSIMDGALWLLSHEHAQDAEILLGQARSIMPDDLQLISLYADMLIQQHRSEEALAQLGEFAQKHPENGSAQAELALAMLRSGKTDGVIKIFQKIPKKLFTPQIRFAYAQALSISHRFHDAERQLQLAVKNDPDYVEAWQLLALTKEELGKAREAQDIYRQLLDSDPANGSARIFLIRLEIHGNDMKGAVKSIMDSPQPARVAVTTIAMLLDEKQVSTAEKLLILLEKQPHAPKELYFYHGLLLYENGKDVDKVLAFLDKVPSSTPEYEKALQLKADIAYERQDVAQAEKLLEQLREINPNNPDSFLMSVELLLRQHEYDKAEAMLADMMKKHPGSDRLEFQMAFLRDLQGRKEEALRMMESIIERFPNNALALNYVGYSLAEDNRDLDRALMLLERAVTLLPNTDFVIDSLAWVHFRRGDMDEAWKQIQRVVQPQSKARNMDPTMLEHYGDIAMAKGFNAKAVQAWEEAETIFLRMGDSDSASRIRAKLERYGK